VLTNPPHVVSRILLSMLRLVTHKNVRKTAQMGDGVSGQHGRSALQLALADTNGKVEKLYNRPTTVEKW